MDITPFLGYDKRGWIYEGNRWPDTIDYTKKKHWQIGWGSQRKKSYRNAKPESDEKRMVRRPADDCSSSVKYLKMIPTPGKGMMETNNREQQEKQIEENPNVKWESLKAVRVYKIQYCNYINFQTLGKISKKLFERNALAQIWDIATSLNN